MDSILNIGLMLIVFIIVLALAYFVSKLISVQNGHLQKKKNLKVIETIQIAPHKYVQLIQVGNRYYAIGISKDHITTIDQFDEDDLDLSEITQSTSFKSVLKKVVSNTKQQNQEEEQ